MGVNKRPAELMDAAEIDSSEEVPDAKMTEAVGSGEKDVDMNPPSAKKSKKSPAKKKKKVMGMGTVLPIQPKNPVALLNELRQNLVFDLISQTGPVHAPVFTMKVVVDGVTFSGEGKSKKQAKLVAAKNALSALLLEHQQQQPLQFEQMAPFPIIEYNRGGAVVEVDFTSDDPTDANFIINEMNRIQTNANQMFPDAQLPLTVANAAAAAMPMGPLTALPGNQNISSNNGGSVGAGMRPPPANCKSGNEKDDKEKKKIIRFKQEPLEKENHEDSGQGPDLVDELEEDFRAIEFPSTKGARNGDNEDPAKDSQEEEEEEDSDVVEFTPEILEIIRISVDHYLDYDLEVQNAAKQKLIVPEKGPVMLLYELFNDIQFECVQTDGGQFSRFKMRVKVNDEVFEGTGPSKRLAKTAAAKAALAQLRNISYSPMQSKHLSRGDSGGDLNMTPDQMSSMDQQESFGTELPQMLADGIGKLVQEKFAELMAGQETYAKRKVLAGIVMTENGQLENAKVISVSTGTKCINGEHISIIGAVVNDCHAEIISRRCLMVFLYSQLRLLFSEETKAASIFEECKEQPEFYQLKDGIEFHLYINTAPCGDARIFSPHDAENNNVDKHPNRKARGQLRTKIESGEGTIPAKNNSGIQTWDGVIQGQRLLTMSCSDKIAKWNVMGIQGSLLASLIRPIYLSSIVLGSLLHPAHMYRAVCGRIESAVENLPSPYYLNRPKLALVTSAETRNQLKAPNFSVNWTYGDAEVEIINSVTGKTIHSQVSRISKQMFIVRYMSAAQHLKACPPKLEHDYGELKAAVTEYQEVKEQLYKAFEKEDLGVWLKKPVEQDQFTVQH